MSGHKSFHALFVVATNKRARRFQVRICWRRLSKMLQPLIAHPCAPTKKLTLRLCLSTYDKSKSTICKLHETRTKSNTPHGNRKFRIVHLLANGRASDQMESIAARFARHCGVGFICTVHHMDGSTVGDTVRLAGTPPHPSYRPPFTAISRKYRSLICRPHTTASSCGHHRPLVVSMPHPRSRCCSPC